MLKRSILVALFILLLIPSLFLIWRSVEYFSDPGKSKTFLKPELKFSHLYVYGFSKDKIELSSDVILTNHLSFALKADSISYTLFMEASKFYTRFITIS